jgi:hypothetical protein
MDGGVLLRLKIDLALHYYVDSSFRMQHSIQLSLGSASIDLEKSLASALVTSC